jgi:NAD(P)-dependent dehydrogenase (short-subunit alcohol dehydrogenase family)
MPVKLEGKVFVITGAKGGLGTYVTNAFLSEGATVIGVSRSIQDSDFPHPAFFAKKAELSSSDGARTVLDEIAADRGGVDGIVHLTGAFAGGQKLSDTDDSTLDRMLDVNIRSAFYVMRAAIPHMHARGSGRLLAIGSRAATDPQAMTAAYSASKAALVSLIRTAALENKDRGITANVLLPGTMDTPANRAAMPGADFSRWISPDQVASLLVHLASDAGAHVTGAVIPVYGGEL